MALDERTHPDLFAGVGIAGVELAERAELVARVAVDQQDLAGLLVLDDVRGARIGIALGVIVELLVPDHLAGLGVERDHRGVERPEEDLVAVEGGAAADHVATGTDVIGQAGGIGPDLLAGLRVEREDARIGRRDVDDAVSHERLAFLAALLLVAEGERPFRLQEADVLGVDLLERRVALGLDAHAVHQNVVVGVLVVEDVLPGDSPGRGLLSFLGLLRGGRPGQHAGEEQRRSGCEQQRAGRGARLCPCHASLPCGPCATRAGPLLKRFSRSAPMRAVSAQHMTGRTGSRILTFVYGSYEILMNGRFAQFSLRKSMFVMVSLT